MRRYQLVIDDTGSVEDIHAFTRSSWLNCALRDDEAVYWVSMRRYQLVIDDTGSVKDIHAFIYSTKWRSGQVLPMPD